MAVGTAAELRAWLSVHHAQHDSVWLVTWKKGSPEYLASDDIVDEALCFGWVDSVPRKLDDTRTMRLLSPRRIGSGWSAVNKAKIERLIAEGRMTEAGLGKIDAAKADGSWDRLTSVDALEVPADLATALAADPVAARYFEAFPASARRGILEWIGNAKADATRRKRIDDTVGKARRNIKANHPAGRNSGPGGVVPD